EGAHILGPSDLVRIRIGNEASYDLNLKAGSDLQIILNTPVGEPLRIRIPIPECIWPGQTMPVR
ncbi:MAG TPA: hypothetical protein PKX44_03825, partial [Methanomassiliicoccaceae archaeon]|nr:hypothetical protein [Methanomassiliicoccaceae archaeon]